tara:strand:+ start:112 stop:744 length:633 start_codon:yes stop_codon:yes gene_type:complete
MKNKTNFIDIFKNNIIDKSELINMNDNKKGWQSKITFYKVSDECKKKIFNQCSIELIDNIIIKKEFIDHKRYRKIKNYKQQFQCEIDALLLLSDCNHFPKLLSYDDNTNIIYISYCGTPLSSENIPNDWNNQLLTIMNNLKDKNIYHNDMICMSSLNKGNFCVSNKILYLIDFGWASKNKPEFPNQNITLEDMYINKEYKKMLKYEKKNK